MAEKIDPRGLGITIKDILASHSRGEKREFLFPRDSKEITPHKALAIKVRLGMRDKGLTVEFLANNLEITRDEAVDICCGSFPLDELPIEISKLEQELGFSENELSDELAKYLPSDDIIQ